MIANWLFTFFSPGFRNCQWWLSKGEFSLLGGCCLLSINGYLTDTAGFKNPPVFTHGQMGSVSYGYSIAMFDSRSYLHRSIWWMRWCFATLKSPGFRAKTLGYLSQWLVAIPPRNASRIIQGNCSFNDVAESIGVISGQFFSECRENLLLVGPVTMRLMISWW